MRRIVSLLVLVGLYAAGIGLMTLDGGGCAAQPDGAAASTQPTAQEQRIGAIVEVREAYATAENVVTTLLRSKLISNATAIQARNLFKVGRDAIEAADATLATSTDVQWSAALSGVWKTLDDATAIYAPNAPKPSGARKT